MTDRLYYADSYLKVFNARVLEIKSGAVRLDRTAFYPTSGGQPHDTGTLGGLGVCDVYVDDAGEVWHAVEGALAEGALVEGMIDWPRRFDHMQQHAGEHMLAGAIHKKLGGYTIGLHLGAEISTIDVRLPGGAMRVTEAILDEIEDQVNADIQKDLPIRAWFPTADEMNKLPLRKPPAVSEHIRVLLVGDQADGECVACGGTHPSSSGQIGLMRILDARPSRGKMRVTFVCGMRALRDARARARAAERAAAALSVPFGELPEAVLNLNDRLHAAKAELEREKKTQALCHADQLWAAAPVVGGWRVVKESLKGLNAAALREMASGLAERARTLAVLESEQPEGECLVVFARSQGEGPNMGALLSEAVRTLGGKGGGRAEFAQGGAPGRGAADMGLNLLEQMLVRDSRQE